MRLALALAALITVGAAPGWAAPSLGEGRPELRLRFVNTSPDSLREIYACPSGSSNWGKNLLGKRLLKPGQRVTLRVPGPCGAYDLRLVAGDGETEYLEEELELCNSSAASAAARAGAAVPRGEDEEDVVTVGAGALTHSKPRSRR